MTEHQSATVDPDQIAFFARQAELWWDPHGFAAPLHRINPVRLRFMRDHLVAHFGRDPTSLTPFAGLTLLDIGCGAGLTAEPMTRLGFAVTGIDAAAEMLAAARFHAALGDLAIGYRDTTAEALVGEGASFDAVLALEVVEHVAEPESFLATAARLVKPGGAFIASTLNRTARAYLLGIVAAERIMGWVPPRTHDWRRFLRPSELAGALRREGLKLEALAGITYDPLRNRWGLSRDIGVNYMLYAKRTVD